MRQIKNKLNFSLYRVIDMNVTHSRLLNLINFFFTVCATYLFMYAAAYFEWSHSCDAYMIYCEYWYTSLRLLSDVICHMQVISSLELRRWKHFWYANFGTFCPLSLHQKYSILLLSMNSHSFRCPMAMRKDEKISFYILQVFV